jgi:hypothetical protein
MGYVHLTHRIRFPQKIPISRWMWLNSRIQIVVSPSCFVASTFVASTSSSSALTPFYYQNILTFTPPGFKHSLNVKFPDSRLAVCEKCKKNFKTRDMCRVRNTHTTAPWTTAYICITIDDSCLDQYGKYIDRPMTVRMVSWQPFCVRKPFDGKTPVCASCKRTNRTRSFCRERHKHRQLPWCTVYVLLTALDQTDPATIVAAASTKIDDKDLVGEEERKHTEEQEDRGEPSERMAAVAGTSPLHTDPPSPESPILTPTTHRSLTQSPTNGGLKTISSDDGDEGDDINDIAESRTFLAKVSYRGSSIHWLELADPDGTEMMGGPVATMMMTRQQPSSGALNVHIGPDGLAYATMSSSHDPHHHPHPLSIPPPPPPGHGYPWSYTAQHHQNALNSQHQYFYQMQQQSQHNQPRIPGPHAPPSVYSHRMHPPPWPSPYGFHHLPPPPPHHHHHPLHHNETMSGMVSVSGGGSDTSPDAVAAAASSPLARSPATAGEAAAAQQSMRAHAVEDTPRRSSPSVMHTTPSHQHQYYPFAPYPWGNLHYGSNMEPYNTVTDPRSPAANNFVATTAAATPASLSTVASPADVLLTSPGGEILTTTASDDQQRDYTEEEQVQVEEAIEKRIEEELQGTSDQVDNIGNVSVDEPNSETKRQRIT